MVLSIAFLAYVEVVSIPDFPARALTGDTTFGGDANVVLVDSGRWYSNAVGAHPVLCLSDHSVQLESCESGTGGFGTIAGSLAVALRT